MGLLFGLTPLTKGLKQVVTDNNNQSNHVFDDHL